MSGFLKGYDVIYYMIHMGLSISQRLMIGSRTELILTGVYNFQLSYQAHSFLKNFSLIYNTFKLKER